MPMMAMTQRSSIRVKARQDPRRIRRDEQAFGSVFMRPDNSVGENAYPFDRGESNCSRAQRAMLTAEAGQRERLYGLRILKSLLDFQQELLRGEWLFEKHQVL